MPAPIDVHGNFTSDQLREIAEQLPDRSHARRVRAIAAILDGKTRAEAASIGGMERQTLRDWVHRFNTDGPDGLKNLRPTGRPPKLTPSQRRELASIIANGPDAQAHGVSRWRLADVVRVIRDRFGVDHDEVSVGRIMKKLGYVYNGAEWRIAPPGTEGKSATEGADTGARAGSSAQRQTTPAAQSAWGEMWLDY
jgi:transposase